MIIVLILFLFFGASYIEDNVLHLKQTSKAFCFIGLAFIPMFLTSISLFSLLGKYLSFYGSGKYIYLNISSIITTFIYYFNAKYKNNKTIGIGSMIFSIISIILFSLVFTTNQTVIMLLLAGSLALLCYFIYNKKHNSYIVLFILFIILHLNAFNESKYISLLLVSIGTFISYLVKEKNNIFKGLLYTYLLILIKFIFKDLGWTNLSIFNYGPYLIWWPFMTRDIIKKYDINTYKIFEYLGYILINVYSLGNYTSEFDGLIFVFLLTLIVIVSYILKLGPVFLVSLLAILINVLLLTRTFWLSIPWWIYILIVGIILIIFAIYNELSIKKDSTSLIKKIKDKLNI